MISRRALLGAPFVGALAAALGRILPSREPEVVFGNWEDMIVARWDGLDVSDFVERVPPPPRLFDLDDALEYPRAINCRCLTTPTLPDD